MVAVSPQTQKRNESIQRQKDLGFDVLNDAANAVSRAYGLVYALPDDLQGVYQNTFGLNLPLYNGEDSWTLPMPARYVIDSGGIIRYAAVSPDYTRRPEPELTLDALRGL